MNKTIVALYEDHDHARMAVQDLVDKGIPRDQISLMANNSMRDRNIMGSSTMPQDVKTSGTAEGVGTGAGVGAAIGGIGGLLVGLGALVIPGIGPVLAAGPLAAALGGIAGAGAGAVAGGAAGGLVGALTDIGVSDEQAGYYAEGIRRGGTLVTVQTEDNRASQIVDVMNSHEPVDVRSRASEWRSAGWTRFDPNGSPYSGDTSHTSRPGSYYTGSDIDVNPDATRSPRTDKDYTVEDDRGNFIGRTSDTLRDQPSSTMHNETMYGSTPRTESTGMTGMDTPVTGMQARSFDYYEDDFRRDYDTLYTNSGYSYKQYQPAYRYGYDLAVDKKYSDYDWNRLEPEARMRWERDYPDSAWDDFKSAVRHAWQNVKETFR